MKYKSTQPSTDPVAAVSAYSGIRAGCSMESSIRRRAVITRKVAGVVNAEFESADAAKVTRVAYLMEVAELRKSLGMNFGNAANSIENGFIIENLKIRVGGGAGQRVPGVGMPVIEGMQAIFAAKSGFDTVGAQRNAHGQKAACDALGHAHDVGRNIRQIAGKHFSCTAEPGKNFVGDKKNVVLRAESANFLQELNRVNDHAARALKQGLDDDGGDFVGAFGQQVFQLLDAFDVAGFALQADGTTR